MSKLLEEKIKDIFKSMVVDLAKAYNSNKPGFDFDHYGEQIMELFASEEKRIRIDEVEIMPHERRPEQHEFNDGKFNGNCDCYKGRRLRKIRQITGEEDK